MPLPQCLPFPFPLLWYPLLHIFVFLAALTNSHTSAIFPTPPAPSTTDNLPRRSLHPSHSAVRSRTFARAILRRNTQARIVIHLRSSLRLSFRVPQPTRLTNFLSPEGPRAHRSHYKCTSGTLWFSPCVTRPSIRRTPPASSCLRSPSIATPSSLPSTCHWSFCRSSNSCIGHLHYSIIRRVIDKD